MKKDVVIIGAGLTGLSAGVELTKRGVSVVILEKANRSGGQIRTFHEEGFTFESGPTTGSGVTEEVMTLFKELNPDCEIEFAKKEAEKRLIWKNGKFYALPNGLWGGITTPLFTLSDKFRILGEPWRAKGTDPDESVGALASRRLGKSFVDYAVEPFLSGVYAGNAYSLVTRHALPKLYQLEQIYGSFIKGAIAKAKEAKHHPKPKTPSSIFSAKGGLENLTKAMTTYLGKDRIFLSAENIIIQPDPETGIWKTTCRQNGQCLTFTSPHVITTVGAYALPDILPFVDKTNLAKIANLRYAPVVQIAVGVKNKGKLNFNAFGGLISPKDKEDFLGILFPSSCFDNRSPENGILFSFFMGGMHRSELTELNNNEITDKVIRQFHRMLGFPIAKEPDLIRIFRHKYAIPQYERSSEERFKTVELLEKKYRGLHLAGNLRDGIGMNQRITQGIKLAREIG
ncbi:protoporphyrinogen oxidase [Anaerorudis cellulosivorans]|uniref:protoporphyrinogen oxidase n=1 Tax=Anaerorudis cellulosivorans TaxID=3397862 RepID=UPI002220E81A|nr:protoporphyrinogen oxidase [Seramator thermalis]MCW1735755.1 protoporphyrinogen oxidase [Seramator thermalis]